MFSGIDFFKKLYYNKYTSEKIIIIVYNLE